MGGLTTGKRAGIDQELIASELTRARARTAGLVDRLSEEQLLVQVSPLMSPPVWDFAHIGYFEELWLLRELGGEPPARAEHDDVYDAFAHERSERGELPILQPSAAREYVADVRGRVLVLLPTVSLGGTDPLLENGFLFGMIVQHELQHIETMTQTLQLGSLPGPEQSAPPPVTTSGDVLVEAESFLLGADEDAFWAYDNERPRHEVVLPAFRIDRGLVSNGNWLDFIAGGRYRDQALWSDAGWEWRTSEQAEAPLYWEPDGDRWARRRFDRVEPVPRGSRCSMSLVRGGCLRSLGRQAAAERSGVGKSSASCLQRARTPAGGGLAVDLVALPRLPGIPRVSVPGVL